MNKDWEVIIDRYIRYELSAEEETLFRELLHNEPKFREQLEFTQALVDSLERLHEEEALAEMLENEKKKPAATKRRIRPLIGLLAAASIFLLFYIGLGNKYSSGELYDMYYAPLAYEEDYSRSSSTQLSIPQKIDIQQALDLYKEQKYSEVPKLLDPIIAVVDKAYLSEDVLFYNAVCKIETGAASEAVTILQYVITNGELFVQDAQWYLALLHLKEGNEAKSIELLEQLKEGEYAGKANNLLKQIKQKRWF
ncbi:tol-pal system YbgF family protein [Bacteroides sp. 519]|uniref:tetratricopeptide repeat protein n=1 Tax=Bacteroides sp. 519 TaxID=2302937 RepID=UPI0013D7A235|nr:hypothetical protein [Bacteroides sp. 519]NDV57269.1 hypothetical protein [Bacteroides sp. 519]